MEASDTFGAGVEAPVDDPFAGSDEEFSQSGQDPLAEDLPVVDREGNPVGEEQQIAEAHAALDEQSAAAGEREPEANAQQELAAADPLSAPTGGGETASSAAPTESAASASAESSEADPTQGQSPAPTNGDTSPNPEGDASPAAPDAAAPAASPESGSPSTASATEPETGDAPEPEEKKSKKGEVTHRRYLLFQPDGDGKWREVHWYEKDDMIVKQGTPGAKKQRVCLARGQDEALGVGYAALGSPPEGCKLVAVAATYFQLRDVAPDPVQPIRQKLKIR